MQLTPCHRIHDFFALISVIAALSSFSFHVLGCNGFNKRSQPSAGPPRTAPTRELEWGDLNILHTTDSHGWLIVSYSENPRVLLQNKLRSIFQLIVQGNQSVISRQKNPNRITVVISYVDPLGQPGDFQSFVQRLKVKARQKKVDLLVVDSGDLHDGNGFSDAEPLVHPGVPRGSTSSKIFARVPYDILAIGNHELYDIEIAQNMHDHFAPAWKGSYLTSNVNITTSGISVPLGSRYRKFTTEQGRRVTAFGILFHFTGNANGTIVQPPAELVREPWFKAAIQDKPDLFLLAGHMGVHDSDWQLVLDSIRTVHPDVPVIILGGHYHIRDCRQLDDRSMSLASGRYMETIGWMSLSDLDNPAQKVQFSRRYLDANRLTYEYHAGHRFDTSEGVKTTELLTKKAREFHLQRAYGVAPHSFYGYRVPSTSPDSLSYLFTGPDGVFETVVKNHQRSSSLLGIIHTTAMRADLYAGKFTANDQFITMPFNNSFQYIPDVPRVTADQVLGILNAGGPVRSKSRLQRIRRQFEHLDVRTKDAKYHAGDDVHDHYLAWMQLQFEHDPQQVVLSSGSSSNGNEMDHPKVSYGYVTKDQCPGYGDDTVHTPLPYVDQTEYVGTRIPTDAVSVDIVFDSFTAKFILEALNKVQVLGSMSNHNYTLKDVRHYSSLRANEVLGIYAQQKWN